MKNNLISALTALLAGALYSQAYPSFLGEGHFFLIFIALPLFLWKLEESNFKFSLLLILFFNLGLDLFGYYWIPHTLREFGELPYFISVILGSLFCLILQPHWWIYALWRKYRPKIDWTQERWILLTALILTLLERYSPQQFPSFVGSPWLHLAPYLGLTPIFGVALFSFMTYWLSLEIVVQIKNKEVRWMPWMSFILFVGCNTLFALKNLSSDQKLNIRLVQANIGNFLKVSSEKGDENSFEAITATYRRLSMSGNSQPDLIIWPETAYSEYFNGEQSRLDSVFLDIMNATGSEMLIGGYDLNTAKAPHDFIESVFNASILIGDGRVRTSYHKNILIPFGETLPFGPLNKKIVSIVPAISLFAKGQGTPKMETKKGLRFVTPICYEILESDFMRSLLNQWGGNRFIVNHTNDSWYGDTAEPRQHLFLSKWRALEFQLPIIRSTNTGISSVIYPDGSESQRLNIGEVKSVDLEIPLGEAHSTFYLEWGIIPTLIIGLFLWGILIMKQKLLARS